MNATDEQARHLMLSDVAWFRHVYIHDLTDAERLRLHAEAAADSLAAAILDVVLPSTEERAHG